MGPDQALNLCKRKASQSRDAAEARAPTQGRVESTLSDLWPAAGDSVGNPSRVNRDTWVLARESRELDLAEGLFQAELRALRGGGAGERMDPDTRHCTGHPCSTTGKRFGGNPVEKS